jgi:hypothetical protein
MGEDQAPKIPESLWSPSFPGTWKLAVHNKGAQGSLLAPLDLLCEYLTRSGATFLELRPEALHNPKVREQGSPFPPRKRCRQSGHRRLGRETESEWS